MRICEKNKLMMMIHEGEMMRINEKLMMMMIK
jgi:hypothetical protein